MTEIETDVISDLIVYYSDSYYWNSYDCFKLWPSQLNLPLPYILETLIPQLPTHLSLYKRVFIFSFFIRAMYYVFVINSLMNL